MLTALETAVVTFLSLVRGLLPTLGVASSSVVSNVVASITALVPVIANNLPNLVGAVQNIFSEIPSNGTPLTTAQIAALQAASDASDAAFEAAAAADGVAADPAATGP